MLWTASRATITYPAKLTRPTISLCAGIDAGLRATLMMTGPRARSDDGGAAFESNGFPPGADVTDPVPNGLTLKVGQQGPAIVAALGVVAGLALPACANFPHFRRLRSALAGSSPATGVNATSSGSASAELPETAPAGDLTSQVAWRGIRLPCRFAVGGATGTRYLGRAALALAENTRDRELVGYAHAGLAAVLAAAGESHGAAAEMSASSAYRAKGDVVSAPRLDVVPVAEVRTSTETLSTSG
jgi:hypothetical protein